MYYGARYYLPEMRRFISAEPIVPGASNPLAYNRYAYVFNNPIMYTDPSGHAPCIDGIICTNPNEYQGNAIHNYTSPSKEEDRYFTPDDINLITVVSGRDGIEAINDWLDNGHTPQSILEDLDEYVPDRIWSTENFVPNLAEEYPVVDDIVDGIGQVSTFLQDSSTAISVTGLGWALTWAGIGCGLAGSASASIGCPAGAALGYGTAEGIYAATLGQIEAGVSFGSFLFGASHELLTGSTRLDVYETHATYVISSSMVVDVSSAVLSLQPFASIDVSIDAATNLHGSSVSHTGVGIFEILGVNGSMIHLPHQYYITPNLQRNPYYIQLGESDG